MDALRGWLGLAVALVACFAVAGVGGWFTSQSVGTWYQGLDKPTWTPPGSLFGPVWTVLYCMMAVALWLVWRRVPADQFPTPTVAFGIQLTLNLLWSVVFFGARRPDLAFAEIVALWLAIVVTAAVFWRHSRAASLLLAPYLLWVTYASALTFALWRLNL